MFDNSSFDLRNDEKQIKSLPIAEFEYRQIASTTQVDEANFAGGAKYFKWNPGSSVNRWNPKWSYFRSRWRLTKADGTQLSSKDDVGLAMFMMGNLFLNATFYQISQEAMSDSNVINYFCSKNETLESYQRQFRRETNLSEDFISKLTYDQAVPIWKKLNDII